MEEYGGGLALALHQQKGRIMHDYLASERHTLRAFHPRDEHDPSDVKAGIIHGVKGTRSSIASALSKSYVWRGENNPAAAILKAQLVKLGIE